MKPVGHHWQQEAAIGNFKEVTWSWQNRSFAYPVLRMNDARGEVLGLASVSIYKEVVQSRSELSDVLDMEAKTEVIFSHSWPRNPYHLES
jgi:hypothetical protein